MSATPYEIEQDNGFRVFQGLISGVGLSLIFWAALITVIVLLSH
jgi:hypothetical protein